MKQTEEKMERYLRSVSRHLRLSKDMKKRVESDLRTDIQLRLESGQDIEEILEDLGSPAEAAGYFNEEMADAKITQHRSISWVFLVAAGVALILLAVKFVYRWNLETGFGPAISIIGGADGPTSIFLAGKIGNPLADLLRGAAIIQGFLAAYFLAGKCMAGRRDRAALVLSMTGTVCFLLGIVAYIPDTSTGAAGSLGYLIQMSLAGDNVLLFLLSLLPVITLIVSLRKRK